MSTLRNFLTSYALHLTLICLAAITFLSLYPVEFPELPGKDKTGHFIAYAACALPVSFARPKRLHLIVLAILLWSGGMEIVQPFVNRHGDWLDLAANTGGIGIGYLLGTVMSRIWPK